MALDTYTTLGSGDIVMSPNRSVLGPHEAVRATLAFGWSDAASRPSSSGWSPPGTGPRSDPNPPAIDESSGRVATLRETFATVDRALE